MAVCCDKLKIGHYHLWQFTSKLIVHLFGREQISFSWALHGCCGSHWQRNIRDLRDLFHILLHISFCQHDNRTTIFNTDNKYYLQLSIASHVNYLKLNNLFLPNTCCILLHWRKTYLHLPATLLISHCFAIITQPRTFLTCSHPVCSELSNVFATQVSLT